MLRNLLFLFLLLLLTGCSYKQPTVSQSSIVIFKTPLLKFYDKGFINIYDDHIHLQIFEVGQVVLDLLIYKDKICENSFRCMDAKSFNAKYLDSSYKEDFLYNLFSQKTIYYKDKEHGILIKVK